MMGGHGENATFSATVWFMSKKMKIMGANTKFKNQVSTSSREYLLRQAKDPYVKKAMQEGYRSRAAFKLLEINEKHDFLKKEQSVVDLGAAPGGWSQVLARQVGGESSLLALDILPMDDIEGVDVLCGDFQEEEVEAALMEKCPEGVDVVLSDMAPNTSGQADLDHLRSMALAELAFDFAQKKLKPGGVFLCKLFQGGEEAAFRDTLRQHFNKVSFEKPAASRGDSREIFVLGVGKKA